MRRQTWRLTSSADGLSPAEEAGFFFMVQGFFKEAVSMAGQMAIART
jgi:hypothetical protein